MQIADALRGEKGPQLAYLLKPVEEHGKSLLKEFRNPTVSPGKLWIVIPDIEFRKP